MLKKQIILLFLVICFCSHLSAQWVLANGFRAGQVFCSLEKGSDLYIGTELDGVLKSTDNGLNWSKMNNGLPVCPVLSMTKAGSKIIIGTKGYGAYISNDNGLNWMPMNTGLADTTINVLITKDSLIFSGTNDNGVFLSDSNGLVWSSMNSGLSDTTVYSFGIRDSTIYAGTQNGIYESVIGSNHWVSANNGMNNVNVLSLAINDTAIFAGTRNKYVFASYDKGQNWSQLYSGLGDSTIISLAVCANRFFAGTHNGLFASDDHGLNWTLINADWTLNAEIRSLIVFGQHIYAGTSAGSVFLSKDTGTIWNALTTSLYIATPCINVLATKENTLFAGSDGEGIFRSVNGGESWGTLNTGIGPGFSNRTIYSLLVDSSTIFAGTQNGVYLSVDDAEHWVAVNSSLENIWVISLMRSGSNLFAGTNSNGAYKSVDNGLTWTPVISGFSNLSVTSLVKKGTNIFAGTYGGGVFLSSDSGVSWNEVNTGISNPYITTLATIGQTVFAGTDCSGVFYSSDDGLSWTHANLGFSGFDTTIWSMAVYESYLFVGTGSRVFCTKDNGVSWVNITDDLGIGAICSMVAHNEALYAGLLISNIYKRPLSGIIGMTETAKNEEVSLYPNPARDLVNIDLHSLSPLGSTNINLYDIHGRLLIQRKIMQPEFSMDIKGLANGLYLLNIQNEKMNKTLRFVKE